MAADLAADLAGAGAAVAAGLEAEVWEAEAGALAVEEALEARLLLAVAAFAAPPSAAAGLALAQALAR
jgi:hypothetical protein